MEDDARQHIRTLSGRTIEILATPPAIGWCGWTLLFHGGTPTAPVSFAPLEAAAVAGAEAPAVASA